MVQPAVQRLGPQRGERLQANGLSKKKAVLALARKLLVRSWGMMKRGEAWKDPPKPAAPTV